MALRAVVSQEARNGGALHSQVITEFVHGLPVSFTVALYGKESYTGEDRNWSLASLQKRPIELSHPNQEFVGRIGSTLARLGANVTQVFYSPTPTEFNGLVVDWGGLQARIDLPSGVNIFRGKRADGVVLPKGTAGFVISSGGCPIIVATDGRTYVVAHAGIDSLTGYIGKHVGVVPQVVDCFKKQAVAWVFYSIRPERFVYSSTDPKYGTANRKLHERLERRGYEACVREGGGIDLPTLICLQFKRMGVLCAESSDECRYLPDGAYDTACPAPFNRYRNLVIVVVNGID